MPSSCTLRHSATARFPPALSPATTTDDAVVPIAAPFASAQPYAWTVSLSATGNCASGARL